MNFISDEKALLSFVHTLSAARFSRYLQSARNDRALAVRLYVSNGRLSCVLYGAVQVWEVVLRNRINAFLLWKYGSGWPFAGSKLLRNLSNHDLLRLRTVVERQERKRGFGGVTVDHVVADLPAGFWVSLLTKRYDVPFAWRNNLSFIFPQDPYVERAHAARVCDELLSLRNRLAHHEPVYHLPLRQRWENLTWTVACICPAHLSYLREAYDFDSIWREHERLLA